MRRKYLIAIAVLLLFAATWFALSGRDAHPSDESLIRNFDQHRDAFATLVRAAQRDSDVMTISPSYVMFSDYRIWSSIDGEGFSHHRLSEYRRLFAELGGRKMDRMEKDSEVIYVPASVVVKDLDDAQFVIIEKGYAYTRRELSAHAESLDGLGFESQGTHYRKIADEWYLFHSWGIGKPE